MKKIIALMIAVAFSASAFAAEAPATADTKTETVKTTKTETVKTETAKPAVVKANEKSKVKTKKSIKHVVATKTEKAEVKAAPAK